MTKLSLKGASIVIAIIATLFIANLLLYTQCEMNYPPRSQSDCVEVALKEFRDHYYDVDQPVKPSELRGPIIREVDSGYVHVAWYKELCWGDSAIYYVRVMKNYPNDTTDSDLEAMRLRYWNPNKHMNFQWSYLYGPIPFADSLFPDSATFQIVKSNARLPNDADPQRILGLSCPDTLIYRFLREGYFVVKRYDDDSALIEFRHRFISIYREIEMDTVKTDGAIVRRVGETSYEVTPYLIPIEFRRHYKGLERF